MRQERSVHHSLPTRSCMFKERSLDLVSLSLSLSLSLSRQFSKRKRKKGEEFLSFSPTSFSLYFVMGNEISSFAQHCKPAWAASAVEMSQQGRSEEKHTHPAPLFPGCGCGWTCPMALPAVLHTSPHSRPAHQPGPCNTRQRAGDSGSVLHVLGAQCARASN